MSTQTFDCEQCGKSFSRERTAGRPPKRCPECRALKELDYHAFHNDWDRSSNDRSMVDEIAEQLGSSRAEALRTAVRVYHAILFQKK